jgi:hypothetical protein
MCHARKRRVYSRYAARVVVLVPDSNVHSVIPAQEVRNNVVLALNVLQLWMELCHFNLQPVECLGVGG